MGEKDQAQVDIIEKGKAYGGVAARLLANEMSVNALRTNDLLLYDEWKHIDTTILKAFQLRLVGVADLQARGLTYPIPNGLGKTVLAWQDASDIEDASLSMDAVTKGRRDRPAFEIRYTPLPIIHYDFYFSIRDIEASRNGNMPLDTTMASMAARKVAEKAEELLFTGSDSYTFGGGTIYGYATAQNRNTGSLTANWDDSAADGDSILTDVLAMKQALIDARRYGPYGIYIPTNFETAIEEDFKANSDKSIRERLMQVDQLDFMKVADKLTADNVIMTQLTEDSIRLVEGLPVTTVQWDTEGGMVVNFKVMAILIPQPRYDQENRSGIAHWS